MGSRSKDRGGGSAGGPVAELSLPRFAILTAVQEHSAPGSLPGHCGEWRCSQAKSSCIDGLLYHIQIYGWAHVRFI